MSTAPGDLLPLTASRVCLLTDLSSSFLSSRSGGGGGDDGGDDDDYFGGEDDGEGGDGNGKGRGEGFGLMRALIPEAYDKLSIAAVFAEWMRTVADLPLIIRRAVEMGLFSSAQLVRFFSMDVRPSIARTVSRNLPPTVRATRTGLLDHVPIFGLKSHGGLEIVLSTLTA